MKTWASWEEKDIVYEIIDRESPDMIPDEEIPLYGTELWSKLSSKEINKIRGQYASKEICQLFHGDYGGVKALERMKENRQKANLKDDYCDAALDHQIKDENKHCTVWKKLIDDNFEWYPVNSHMSEWCQVIQDSSWDDQFLQLQVFAENLAVTAQHDWSKNLKFKDLKNALEKIMADESNHVNFGKKILRDHFKELSPEELKQKQELANWVYFDVYCNLNQDWFWERIGYPLPPQDQSFMDEVRRKLIPSLNYVGLDDPVKSFYGGN